MREVRDSLGIVSSFESGGKSYNYFDIEQLEKKGICELSKFPFSIRILLENVLRNEDGRLIRREDVDHILAYRPDRVPANEIPFMPGRVVMQDFTGVPAVVDLAAMRNAMKDLGGDPAMINPIVGGDLVIDHSVQVDSFGVRDALAYNTRREFERNKERYTVLRWAQNSFTNFHVVPPGTGIVHQVNLEYLAGVVLHKNVGGTETAFPDTLVGTDSHTTMINGLGVLGWGVGGIEAEAVMLGQPYYMMLPQVVGFKLTGELPEGATATDLVLTVVKMLRELGVVGKFVEFFGPGLDRLSLPDRATLANMAPEYGATMGFFPADEATLEYLRLSGRSKEHVDLVESYLRAQGLFRTSDTPEPAFSEVLELDMATVEPSLAGPRRPQDRIPLGDMKKHFHAALKEIFHLPECSLESWESEGGAGGESTGLEGEAPCAGEETSSPAVRLKHGSVVIAAITSCTNTSNPSVMIAAGILAKKALEKGLHTRPWVKTSLAPGSRVVPDYLEKAGLLEALEAQRFNLVGFGCTTCIGNSGPLPDEISRAIAESDLVAAAVLSGNRNFEGRIHSSVRANYLASPPLVVAYALAGRVDIDFESEPIGYDERGEAVYLKDIWPTGGEIEDALRRSLTPEMFAEQYGRVHEGDENWRSLLSGKGVIYDWDPESTYIKKPPFFDGMKVDPEAPSDIENARVLALLGDTVTTDHISPAGAIPPDSPAGKYLMERGIEPKDFNSFGSRRGNHEVMMRGTFGNIRLKNLLVPGVEGGVTVHIPTGERMPIYDAAMKYIEAGIPLIVIAGKEYGTGSSRDWAAKGTALLGVRAVIAESFERIHRSNLIGMGVLPLQFKDGDSRESLGLTGEETYTINGIADGLAPGKELQVIVRGRDGSERSFKIACQLKTPVEVDYYLNGGILQTVLRQMLKD